MGQQSWFIGSLRTPNIFVYSCFFCSAAGGGHPQSLPKLPKASPKPPKASPKHPQNLPKPPQSFPKPPTAFAESPRVSQRPKREKKLLLRPTRIPKK